MKMTCISCAAPLVDDDQRYCKCEYCGTFNPNHARRARIQEEIDLKNASAPRHGSTNVVRIQGNVGKVAIGNNIFQN